jgi:hypothetical protein
MDAESLRRMVAMAITDDAWRLVAAGDYAGAARCLAKLRPVDRQLAVQHALERWQHAVAALETRRHQLAEAEELVTTRALAHQLACGVAGQPMEMLDEVAPEELRAIRIVRRTK